MRLLAISDIHQLSSKWKLLVEKVQEENPDVVVISGDLFPKDRGIPDQLGFMKHIVKYATRINEGGAHLVLMLGNDDNQLLIEPMKEEMNDTGLWAYVADEPVELFGYEFIGMPYVPDYPFAYKYWCHPDMAEAPRQSIKSFGTPVQINHENEFEEIENWDGAFLAKQSIQDALKERVAKVQDMSKSIWLIHAPPANLNLDVCAHGEKVGSYAVLEFLMNNDPLLTIHGHIHESPEYACHKWCDQIGETRVVQNGQIDLCLYYSIIEIENGSIVSMRHSVYGEKEL